MHGRHRPLALKFLILWFALLAGPSLAAEWSPPGAVVLITHATPGTGVDVFVRVIGEIWTKHQILRRGAVVENLTGGAGERARRHVVVQNAGNAQVLFGFTPSQVNTGMLVKSDITVRSFTPIAAMVSEPTVIYVNADSPYKSLSALVEAARSKPKGVAMGGGPFGNSTSLMAKMLGDEAKVEFAYVGYKGGGEGVIALLGNHVQFVMEQPSEVDRLVKAGKLRPLAAAQKIDLYPDLPTFASLGYRFKPLVQFRGIVAPPNIGPEAVGFYVQALDRARQAPEWKDYVKRNELQEMWLTGAQFAAFLDEQEAQYRSLNKEIGLLK
jgi:putative tricarboxylic transport membrane protein